MTSADALYPRLDRPGRLALPFSLSVLVHALLLWFFIVGRGIGTLASSAPVDIELLEPEEAQRRAEQMRGGRPAPAQAEPEPAPAPPRSQIVAVPDSPEAEPEDPRFLSDRNSRAEEEMVKRGEPAPPAQPPREKAERSVAKSERQAEPGGDDAARSAARTEARRLPGLSDLFVKPSEIIGDPSLGSGTSAEKAASEKKGGEYAAIDRPDLWADPGERGTPDYLPDVRQGSFTLLNTKADLFAPFVRRVGLRVFQSFSMDFRRQIFAGQVPQGKERVEIEAVMSRDGRRLEVAVRNRTGNLSTDRVLLATITDQIFFDENPPPKAVAQDGRIHFLFALDAAVWYGRDDPQGPVQPGARWLFGAGLL